APSTDERIQFSHDPLARQRCIHDHRKALAGEVVDDHKDAEAASISENVRDEIEAPALVLRLRRGHRRPRAQSSLAAATAAHRQSLLAVEPEQLLVIELDTLPP